MPAGPFRSPGGTPDGEVDSVPEKGFNHSQEEFYEEGEILWIIGGIRIKKGTKEPRIPR